MEKFHDQRATLPAPSIPPPIPLDRSIATTARARRADRRGASAHARPATPLAAHAPPAAQSAAHARTRGSMMPRRMWKRKRGADGDQSAASVPPESVSPLAAPFAGSCGLSPVDLLYREDESIVARATASRAAAEDQSRYVPRRPRNSRRKLDASSSAALCVASSLSAICLPVDNTSLDPPN